MSTPDPRAGSNGAAGPPASPVEETDDGGAIIKLTDQNTKASATPGEGEGEFYRNLAEEIDSASLSKLALELLERIEFDRKARQPRDDKYAEGIKRSGLGDEAPGSPAFEGASTVVHPMLSKATIYYQSHTISELMPSNGPVRDWIPGEVTQQRQDKAKRKTAHMNWQFKRQMPEFRSELEKLLSQQPLGGSQYLRLVYDSRRKRPVPVFVPLDDCFIPESASDFYSAERRTYVDHITQNEFESRIRGGYYREVDNLNPPSLPQGEQSEASKASDKAEGKASSPYNEEGLRDIYVVEALAVIEDTDSMKIAGDSAQAGHLDGGKGEDFDEEPLPYLICLDPYLRTILTITRNWEEKDEQCENMCWMIDFPFIPWRGAQSVGLIHVAGSLAAASTGSLRALLDTALVQNIPTLLMLKGNTPGQSINAAPCTITEIEGGVSGGDIRSRVMAVPFNQPSTMLYQLLGWCTQQGEEIIRTTFENLSEEGSPNMPVGTTLALIEQGMKVLAAIHLRLHGAMDRVIGVLHRINRLYITDKDIVDDTGELLAHQSDYEGPLDVVPVSDPQVFSDIQRFAQLQVVQQRADLHPELYDARKVEELILERTKLPEAKNLLKPQPQIIDTNAVNENLAMGLGRPVAAFPEQDHLAHIQVLLDFAKSPMLGLNPIIAPAFIGASLQHLKEHILYLYLNLMHELTSHAAGGDVGKMTKMKDKGVNTEIDKTLAAASESVIEQLSNLLKNVPPVVQQLQQAAQQYAPKPQPDPTAVATAQVTSAAAAKAKTDATAAKGQSDAAIADKNNQAKLQQVNVEQQGEDQRTAAEIQSREKINADDNATALEISAAKIETGHSTNLSTGTGIEGHRGPTEGGGK